MASVVEQLGEIAHASLGDLAAGAFDAYAEAVDEAISTGRFSTKAFGVALQNVAGSTLKSVGRQAAVKGAFEIAEGIGALADKDQSAGEHFAAAGKFFAVAALSGAASGALSTGGGGGGGGGGGREEAVEPRGSGSGRSRGGGRRRGGVVQRIVVIGDPDPERVAAARESTKRRSPAAGGDR